MRIKKSAFLWLLILLIFTAGCSGEETPAPQASPSSNRLDTLMTSAREQSDGIKTVLEQESLTQTEMNGKARDLAALWDGVLNELLDEAERRLPEEAWKTLQAEQRAWTAERDAAVEEAGKPVEGGSIYPLVVNLEAAKRTEARAYELYELLK